MQRNHPLSRPIGCLLSAIGTLVIPCCSAAWGQNLVMQPQGTSAPATPPPPTTSPVPAPATSSPASTQSAPAAEHASPQVAMAGGGHGGADQLNGLSLFAVVAPAPHKYQKHDVIEVIINESSAENITQTTDMKKDYSLRAELSNFPSLQDLFTRLSLTEGIGAVHPKIGVTSNKELKGTGKIDRKDQVTARLSAFVVDVKPNGNLVLEARESRSTGKEVTTVVLAGTCRPDDITKNNTILSAQMAGLTIRIDHEGDVKDSGSKGFFPRILEAIFNF